MRHIAYCSKMRLFWEIFLLFCSIYVVSAQELIQSGNSHLKNTSDKADLKNSADSSLALKRSKLGDKEDASSSSSSSSSKEDTPMHYPPPSGLRNVNKELLVEQRRIAQVEKEKYLAKLYHNQNIIVKFLTQKQNEQLATKRGGYVPSSKSKTRGSLPSDKSTAKLLLSTLSKDEKESLGNFLSSSNTLDAETISGLLDIHNYRTSHHLARHLQQSNAKSPHSPIKKMSHKFPVSSKKGKLKHSYEPSTPMEGKTYMRSSGEYSVEKESYKDVMKMGGVNQDSKLAKALANVITDNDNTETGAKQMQQKQIFKTGGVNEDSNLAKALSDELAKSYSQLPVANPPLDLNKVRQKNRKLVKSNYLQSMIAAADMPNVNNMSPSQRMVGPIGLPQNLEQEPKSITKFTTTPVVVDQQMPTYGTGFQPPNIAKIGTPMNNDDVPLTAEAMQKAKQDADYVEQEDSALPNEDIKSQFLQATYVPVSIPKVHRQPSNLTPLSSQLIPGPLSLPGTTPLDLPGGGQDFQKLLQADQSASSFQIGAFDLQRSPSLFQLGVVRAKVSDKKASNAKFKGSTATTNKNPVSSRGLRVWSKSKSHAKASSGAAASSNSNSNSATNAKTNQKAQSSTSTQARSKGSKGGSSDYGYGQGSGYGYGTKSWGYGGGGGWAGQPPKGGYPSLPNYGKPPSGVPSGPDWGNAATRPASPAAPAAPAPATGQSQAPVASNAAAQAPAAPSGQKWAKIKPNVSPNVKIDSTKMETKYVNRKVKQINTSKVEKIHSTKDKHYVGRKSQHKHRLSVSKPRTLKKSAKK